MMFVVSYDITSTRRRTKILNTLRDFGIPVQRSVVECDLDSARLGELRDRLRRLLSAKDGQIRIYPLCQNCFFRSEVLGLDPIPLSPRHKKAAAKNPEAWAP